MAHRLCSEACSRQQKLEAELLQRFGSFPRVKIPIFDGDSFIWAYSGKEICRLLPKPEQHQMLKDAKTALAGRWRSWNAADREIGYTRAKRSEREIATVEQDLARQLWRTPPRSIPGAAAKLHAVLECEDPESGLKEAPWPELRQILAELVDLCGTSTVA